MAQVVKPDAGEPGLHQERSKRAAQEIPGFHRLAYPVGKDKAMIFPGRPQAEAMRRLLGTMVA
jgi:hypothetical protein